jgi:hypothetical protein
VGEDLHKKVCFAFTEMRDVTLRTQTRERLREVCLFSRAFCAVVDAREDIQVSFSIYDVFKQYADSDY